MPTKEESSKASVAVVRLLRNFRLLEAAGACELMTCLGEGSDIWWRMLGQASRNYHGALRDVEGPRTIGFHLGMLLGPVEGVDDLKNEVHRLDRELTNWFDEVDGGICYIRFVQSYSAFADLDGERAIDRLRDCLEMLQVHVGLDRRLQGALDYANEVTGSAVMSSYGALQIVADALGGVFKLRRHAFDDMIRFAFIPARLRAMADG